MTIHFNRYNLCFYKYTECRDKCKSLYFIALHIRVVPPLFNPFVECPLSDARCWMIGNFRMDVTERLLNANVVFFLEFLRFAVEFLCSEYWKCLIRWEKCSTMGDIRWKKCNEAELFAWKNVWVQYSTSKRYKQIIPLLVYYWCFVLNLHPKGYNIKGIMLWIY